MQSKKPRHQVIDSFGTFLRQRHKDKSNTFLVDGEPTNVLFVLDELGQQDHLTIDELATYTQQSPFNISVLVDRLRKSDYVDIDPSTEVVSITDAGRNALNYQSIIKE